MTSSKLPACQNWNWILLGCNVWFRHTHLVGLTQSLLLCLLVGLGYSFSLVCIFHLYSFAIRTHRMNWEIFCLFTFREFFYCILKVCRTVKNLVWCLFHLFMFFFFYFHLFHWQVYTEQIHTYTHILKHTYICLILHKRNQSMKIFYHGISNLHVIFCFSLLLTSFFSSAFFSNSFPNPPSITNAYNLVYSFPQTFCTHKIIQMHACVCMHTYSHIQRELLWLLFCKSWNTHIHASLYLCILAFSPLIQYTLQIVPSCLMPDKNLAHFLWLQNFSW